MVRGKILVAQCLNIKFKRVKFDCQIDAVCMYHNFGWFVFSCITKCFDTNVQYWWFTTKSFLNNVGTLL